MSGIRWPVNEDFNISQGFGRPAHFAEPEMWLADDESKCRPTKFPGSSHFEDVHPGIDIACPVGTPLRAVAAGKVIRTTTYRIFDPISQRYVFGRFIMLRFGSAIFLADHLDKFIAGEGENVAKGQMIARTGRSGIVTGPHVHAEVRQATDASASWDAFRWNFRRMVEGRDLANKGFIAA